MVSLGVLLAVGLIQDPTDEEIRKWIQGLGAEYLEEREEARKKLAALGTKAEDPLIEALTDSEYRIRRGAIELLVGMKSTKAVKIVSEIFRNAQEDRTVRMSAFAYLRGAGKDAEDALIEALENEERAFRLGAVQTLKEIRSERCAEKVAELYDRESEKEIKDAAFDCLKNIGKPAQPFLLKLLASTDGAVRLGALEGLRNINAEKKDPEVIDRIGKLFVAETDGTVLGRAYDFLKESGEKAVPHFVTGLSSAVEQVRLSSLQGLAEAKSEAGLDSAAELFARDGSDGVRAAAKEYLEQFGSKSEDHFLKALESENPKVRLLAIDALGKMQSSKPLARISQTFREEKDPEVHRAAFDYLVRIGSPAEDDLILALEDADKKIKLEAAAALGRTRSEKAVPELIRALNAIDAEFKAAAVDALVRVGAKAVEAVQAEVKAGRVKRKDGDQILGLFYQVEVEKILATQISDEGGFGFYEGMFESLKKFGADRAVPVLLQIVKDRSYRARVHEFKGTRDQFDAALRQLSIMALGDLGDAAAVEPLEELLRQAIPIEEEYGEIVVSLFKLGAKQHFDKFTATMIREAEAALTTDYKDEGYTKLFSVGLVQNRVGRRGEAEKTYARLVEVIEQHRRQKEAVEYSSALYNLACLHALKGEKEPAVGFLRRAVVAGFKDRGWIRMDQDLNSLRELETYKALLAEDTLFQEDRD